MMSMRFLFAIPALLTLLAVACGDDDSSPQQQAAGTLTPSASPAVTGCPRFSAQSPDTHTVSINTSSGATVRLIVELADTATERATGLMHRDCLPDDSGMLFAFPDDTTIGFFMKDTLVPLTIAFMRADGGIVYMTDMQPNTLDNHESPEPYRYAIEAQQGWFAENGVAAGDVADIPPALSQNAKN